MANKEKTENLLDKIVSLAKRRGFIYPGSEIYGGLGGTWDYGPLGVSLKNNLRRSWWRKFVEDREDMYGLDASILMKARVWEASGHVAGFADPMVECRECKRRYRADHVKDYKCPECGGDFGEQKMFNMMFKTAIGAVEDSSSVSYLRPETAQGIFVNFKNIIDSFHPKLPFGVAQIGKAFRNEITPKDFIFRTREFEQMEIEYFVQSGDWEKYFDYWKDEMVEWMEEIGLNMNKVTDLEKTDLAHYSKRTVDYEFDFPFGKQELYGLAYRTDYDLKTHSQFSGEDLSYLDAETGEKFTPHVIEPSFGLDRTVLALLTSAYSEDELGGEKRTFLKFKPDIAPVKVAVFPLLKNKPALVEKAHDVYRKLKNKFGNVSFDDNGNIGKRYRRQDEIGTPFCLTIDFDTLSDGTLTVRDRDTGKQERVHENDLEKHLSEKF
jgi:glycyl-tRNA synthetase